MAIGSCVLRTSNGGRTWQTRHGRYAPLPQVYADLFNISGWQAPRFLDALDPQLQLADAA
jgi:hypothetical protein